MARDILKEKGDSFLNGIVVILFATSTSEAGSWWGVAGCATIVFLIWGLEVYRRHTISGEERDSI